MDHRQPLTPAQERSLAKQDRRLAEYRRLNPPSPVVRWSTQVARYTSQGLSLAEALSRCEALKPAGGK